ncbi:MAG: hypothetical protein NUW09_03385 [Deltaproteobacteria bacterium]|nr:hypothetical protein [Deltaproteobacteria bacterium]
MAGMNLMQGGDNPIFQASQKIAEQEASRKDIAIQGIINQNVQIKAKQLGAEMQTNAAFMESKDPFIFERGVEGMYGLMGKPVPQDFFDHQDEMRTAWSEVKKYEGKLPAKEFLALVNSMIDRFPGSAPDVVERAKTAASPMNQPIPPEIAKKYGLPPDYTIEQAKALGLNLTDKSPDVNEFQTFKDSYLLSNPNATGVEVVAAYKKATSGRETYADTQILSRLVDKFIADPNVRAIEKMDEFSQLIKDAVTSENPIAHSAIPTLMARVAGEVGNLSEADKRPFGGGKALLSRLEQALTEMATGKRTAENMGYINQLADSFQNAGIHKKENLARERSKQYAKAYRGKFSEEEIFGMLSPGSEYSPPAAKTTEQPQRRTTDKGTNPLDKFMK